MCFVHKGKPELKIAEEDIVCYKFFYDLRDGELESPFKYHNYKIGIIQRLSIKLSACKSGEDIITEHGYHSIKSQVDALEFLRQNSWNFSYYIIFNLALVKCIIPKGSKYYENNCEYVSDSIIPENIISYHERQSSPKLYTWINSCIQ